VETGKRQQRPAMIELNLDINGCQILLGIDMLALIKDIVLLVN
jgi:hypothetical protein